MASTPGERLRPRRRRQPAGQDGPDVGGGDTAHLGELAADPREEAAGERLVAEDRARLHGRDRVAPDRPVRGTQLDPRQLGGPRRERLEPELQARGDRPADIGAVDGHAVEGGRGPEVDDDRRRAVDPPSREGVDQTVGSDLLRPVDPHGQRHRAGGGQEERPFAAGRDGLGRGGQARDDRGGDHRGHVGERGVIEAQQRVEQGLELVGAGARVRCRAAGHDERAGLEQAERHVGVADVDGQEHGRDDTRRDGLARAVPSASLVHPACPGDDS